MAEVPSPEVVPKLFQTVRVGEIELAHRVVFAPCTRLRATKDNVHTDLGVTYYEQRASVPGTLLISEATLLEPHLPHAPGIFTDEQVVAWKRVRTLSFVRYGGLMPMPGAAGHRRGSRQGLVHIRPALGWRTCNTPGRQSVWYNIVQRVAHPGQGQRGHPCTGDDSRR